ncbi:response regulator transcription factor [Endothiovibrio diazotrophicus]
MDKPRLLVIDDDPNIVELVRAGLSKGFEVDDAMDVASAKVCLDSYRYDLVLCDWMLPDVNGDKLLAWAKQNPRLRDTPFVMVTAKDDKECVVTAIRLGADGYIIKPFTLERLRTKVYSLVEKRPEPQAVECKASLHYRNQLVKGSVKALTRDLLIVAISRHKFPPHIFEEVALQLEQGGNSGSNFRGAVTTLQAEGLALDAEMVEVHIRLQELTDAQRDELSRMECALDGGTD